MKAKALIALLEAQRVNVCKLRRSANYLLKLESVEVDDKLNKKFDSAFNSLGTLIKHANKAIGYDFEPAKYNTAKPIGGAIKQLKDGYNANSEMAIVAGGINGVIASLASIEAVKSILHDRTLQRTEVSKGFKTSYASIVKTLEELSELLPDLVDEDGVAETAKIIAANEESDKEETEEVEEVEEVEETEETEEEE